jgi:hypothetical protein
LQLLQAIHSTDQRGNSPVLEEGNQGIGIKASPLEIGLSVQETINVY